MTQWQVLRKATHEDVARLELAAARFAHRHSIEVVAGGTAVQTLELTLEAQIGEAEVDAEYRATLRGYWRKCAARALRNAQAHGISSGYVGRNV
jgi:hypothetical protein